MKQGLTEIGIIGDISGSMQGKRIRDAREGLNTLLDEQKKVPGECHVTLAKFDTSYTIMFTGVDIKDVPVLTERNYDAGHGSTALLDAIGRTINEIGAGLANTAEDNRPEKVIIAVVTDGEENSSKEFTFQKIKEMIEHQQEKYNWVFMFIGASLESMEQAKAMGFSGNLMGRYNADSSDSTHTYYSALSRGVTMSRGGDAKSVNLNDLASTVANPPDDEDK